MQKVSCAKNVRLRGSPPPLLIGYMRVSKADGSQVLDLQRDALLAAGVKERHLYSDAASGKQDDRLGLAACLRALREGDTLVVWKLDRLGRNLRHLVNVVHDLRMTLWAPVAAWAAVAFVLVLLLGGFQ